MSSFFEHASGAPLENLMRAGSSIPPVTGSKKADGPQEQTILRRLSAIGEADSESGETEDMLAGIKGDVHQVSLATSIASRILLQDRFWGLLCFTYYKKKRARPHDVACA